jgi:L-idonate 5-dehydrogenase
MRACVIHKAEDLRLEEREVPQLTPTGILIRVRAAGICGSDLHYYFEGKNGDLLFGSR